MLKIAVQKSERISKGFLDLLNRCGLKAENNQSKLYCKFNEMPIALYFVRGSDISSLLEEKFDIAILGKDSYLEYNLANKVRIIKNLDFAKCRLSFAGKADANFTLQNKRIATSYVNILKKYLTESQIDAKIIPMNGSVESSIELELADAIFDIIQTGSTLLQHGLVEHQKLLDLEAVMVANRAFNSDILDKLLFRVNAVLNAKPCKYMMFNLPRSLVNTVLEILPAGKSPTIIDLANQEYCAIHTLCTEGEVWDICTKLQQIGAQDILITDVNLRFV